MKYDTTNNMYGDAMEHATPKNHSMDMLENKINNLHLWKTIGLFIIKEAVVENLLRFNNQEDRLLIDLTKKKLLLIIMAIEEKPKKINKKLPTKNKNLTLLQESQQS